MRELILLRHAEALPAGTDGSDRDRPLSLRGEEEARQAGAWLREQGAVFDAALSSPARRAQMTVERALDALGNHIKPRFVAGIYEATPGDLLALLEQHAAPAAAVLLVGHNPGLEQLLALLTEGRSDRARGMPPGSVAWLQLDAGTGRCRTARILVAVKRGAALLLLLACGAAGAAWWPIDSTRSHAQFSVRTLWFTHVRGGFGAVYGELRSVDAQHDVVDARIDTASLQMDDQDTLKEARGPGFFDVANYPRIHFVSEPFPDAALRDGGVLDGTLDLHGQHHEAYFELEPSQCPAQPLTCPVRVQGTLSRGAFGMRAHRGLLSDRVTLTMTIVLGTSR